MRQKLTFKDGRMFGMGCLCMFVVLLGGTGRIGEALGREVQEQENPLPQYGWVDEGDPERWRDSAITLWKSDEPGASRLVEDFIVAVVYMITMADVLETEGETLEKTGEHSCGGFRSIANGAYLGADYLRSRAVRLVHRYGLEDSRYYDGDSIRPLMPGDEDDRTWEFYREYVDGLDASRD